MNWYLLVFLLIASHASTFGQGLNCTTTIDYGNNKTHGKYAEVNGIHMYYETYGDLDNQPLLLIHGNGGSVEMGGCQIEAFKEDHFVVVTDSRGQGKSGMGSGELTYHLMADDYYKLLNDLGLDSVYIIGQSDGAIIGLLLAIEHPSKVKKLVAAAPNLRPDSTALYPWNIDMMIADLEAVKTKIEKGDTSVETGRSKILTEMMLHHPHIGIEELWKIKAPVLLVFGESDYMPFPHIMEIYQNISRSNLLIFPGAGHRSYRLEPDLFNQFCRRFFDRPFERKTAREGF